MTDAELLTKIKSRLNITGTYQDETLLGYIDDAKSYLFDAGVATEILESAASVGVIQRGVSDLWNYGAGEGKFSEYFYQRAIQLKYKELPKPPPTLGELVVVSTEGADFLATKITVTGQSEAALFKYLVAPSEYLPTYDEDLSAWTSWDGVSEIYAEDGHFICVAEVSDKNLARKAGTARVVVYLG